MQEGKGTKTRQMADLEDKGSLAKRNQRTQQQSGGRGNTRSNPEDGGGGDGSSSEDGDNAWDDKSVTSSANDTNLEQLKKIDKKPGQTHVHRWCEGCENKAHH